MRGTDPSRGAAPDVHCGNVWEVARAGHRMRDIPDSSANISPLGYPPWVGRAIAEHLDSLRHRPDPEYRDLTERLVAYLDVTPECLLVRNGSVAGPRPTIDPSGRPPSLEYIRVAHCLMFATSAVALLMGLVSLLLVQQGW